MKLFSSIVFSLFIHSLLIFPTMCAENKDTIISAKGFRISEVEIVPSYVSPKEPEEAVKNPHGKTAHIKKKVTPKPQSKVKGQEKTNIYITKVRKRLTQVIYSNSKFKKMKVKGNALLKIQIQKNGSYDVLHINSENSRLVDLIEQSLYKLESFPEIPEDLGLQELQLKIPLEFNFN